MLIFSEGVYQYIALEDLLILLGRTRGLCKINLFCCIIAFVINLKGKLLW